MNIAQHPNAAALESMVTETIVVDDALQPLMADGPAPGAAALALFSNLAGACEQRPVQVLSQRGDHVRVSLEDGRTQVVHQDSLTPLPSYRTAHPTAQPIADADIERVVAETGMGHVQAYYHLRALRKLRSQGAEQRRANAALSYELLAARLNMAVSLAKAQQA